MTPQLSLTNPNLLKTLRVIRVVLLVLVALGSIVGAYSLYNVRRAVNAENERMEAYHKQINELRAVLVAKRKEARLADTLRTETPDGAGSAFFVQSVNHLAEEMRLSHFMVRMMESTPRPQQAPAAGGNGGGAAPANAPAAGGNAPPADGPLANWNRSGFEVEVAGEFRDLSEFLRRLAAIPFVVEVASIDVHPMSKATKGEQGELLMHLTGTLYGLPEEAAKP